MIYDICMCMRAFCQKAPSWRQKALDVLSSIHPWPGAATGDGHQSIFWGVPNADQASLCYYHIVKYLYTYIYNHIIYIYIYSVNKQAIIKEFLFNKWVSLQKIWNLQTCPNLVLVWCFDVLMFGKKPAFFFIFLGVSIRNSSKPGCRIHIHTHRYYRYRKAA